MFKILKKIASSLYLIGAFATIIFVLSGCSEDNSPNIENVNFRQEMRNFVIEISTYSKGKKEGFLIIPQNGQELITDNGEPDGILQTDYLRAIDATGCEDLYYGYDKDDQQTPSDESQYMRDLCLLFENNNIEVLTTDYCSTPSKREKSYQLNLEEGFISFAAAERNLNQIPTYPSKPFNENSNDISSIAQAKNFLYLINSENFSTKSDFINAVAATNYDLIIMDLYHNDDIYSFEEINQLKRKKNGGKRLVISYMSIGEAEDYRYYWDPNWKPGNPSWLDRENPDWEGNYKVNYWDPKWKDIITGNSNSYLNKILTSGFDGVYLDIIDAFEYYEE